MSEKIEREKFTFPESGIEDYTSRGSWEFKGEVYEFVEDYPSRDCDGECHNVVTQRKSDGKYFEFTWMLSRSENYYYTDGWKEVFKEVVTKINWI
jgi:hypothetical protein